MVYIKFISNRNEKNISIYQYISINQYMNKPIYLRLAILSLSKMKMYEY